MKIFLLSAAAFITALVSAGAEESSQPPQTLPSPPAPDAPPPPLFPTPGKTERLKHTLLVRNLLVRKYDANGDGKLDAQEKELLLRDAEQEKKNARKAFLKRYDRDGDGILTKEERQAMHEQMNRRRRQTFPGKPLPHPPGMVMENRQHEQFMVRPSVFMLAHAILLRQYDANANGIIDPPEFEKIRNEADLLYADKARQLLAKYDADGDGTLSDEEKAAISRNKDAEQATEQDEGLDDIDLFIQESFDEEILECLDEDESDQDES